MSPAPIDFQRQIALELAVKYRVGMPPGHLREHEELLKTARDFYEFLVPQVVPVSASIYFDAPTSQNGTPPMASMTDGDQIVAHISEQDSKGNAADQPGTWSVDRPDLVTVAVADDGMSATFTAVGPTGTAVVSLTVGSLPTATATLDVVPGDAATVDMTFDAPTPAAAPVTPPAPAQGA